MSATVGHECRLTSCVFDKEIRSHRATALRTTLAKGSGEDPVSARHVDLPVPAQHCTVIPRRVAPAGCWCGSSTSSSFRRLHDAGCSSNGSNVLLSARVIECFRRQLHGPETPCRLPSELHRHSLHFGRSLNIHFSIIISWWLVQAHDLCVCTVPTQQFLLW